MSGDRDEKVEPRRSGDGDPQRPRPPAALSAAHVRHMLQPGDRHRERPRRKSVAEALRALFAVLERNPGWTVLGLLVAGLSIIGTLWAVIPRDKNSELLDALTRREHERVEQLTLATSREEIALIEADLEQVRRKASEVISRFSRGEGSAPTSEGTFEPPPETAGGEEAEPHAEAAAEEILDERSEARTRVGASGARPAAGATGGNAGGEGTTDPPPEEPARDGPFGEKKTSTRPVTSAPEDGPVVHVDGPDAPRPALPQVESWVHAGVLRLTLETQPRRRETARDVVRRHRALVDELQWWLPGE